MVVSVCLMFGLLPVWCDFCFTWWLILVRFCYRFVAVFITCVYADSGCYFNSVDLCYAFDAFVLRDLLL